MKTENAPPHSDLTECADIGLNWMLEQAFPLWSRQGIAPSGGFWEALTLSGTPIEDPIARVRVQGRQIYMFCAALSLGWEPDTAEEIIATGVTFLTSACRRADGLYGRTVDLSGQLVDDTIDLYDSAFALFALAAAVTSEVHPPALQAGRDLNHALDSLLQTDEGFLEEVPHTGVRRQNPHMHLLEASLAWFEATGEEDALRRAQKLVDLIGKRFYDPSLPGLHEMFHTDWSAHDSDRLEAGHHYEWVWLLTRAQELGLTIPHLARENLYTQAKRLTRPDGRIALSHTLSGDVREPVFRTWSLTEALKAHLKMETAPDYPEASSTFHRLFSDHLNDAVPGGWLDKFDSDGTCRAQDMPASTGYHVVLALLELIGVSQTRQSAKAGL